MALQNNSISIGKIIPTPEYEIILTHLRTQYYRGLIEGGTFHCSDTRHTIKAFRNNASSVIVLLIQ